MIDVTICSKRVREHLTRIGLQDEVDLGLPKWIQDRWWIELFAGHCKLGTVVLTGMGTVDRELTTPTHEVLSNLLTNSKK